MIPMEESDLAFEFGSRWQLVKFDEHRDYQKMKDILEGTRAIDFLGILDNKELYLIEVKNFRKHRIETKDRLTPPKLPKSRVVRQELVEGKPNQEKLDIEVAQKVRDSLACIIGAHRTSSTPEIWRPYAKLLCSVDARINVVLWLEHDLPSHPQQEEKVRASVQIKVFKKKLIWLTGQVFVCSLDAKGLPDVQVSNLPQS